MITYHSHHHLALWNQLNWSWFGQYKASSTIPVLLRFKLKLNLFHLNSYQISGFGWFWASSIISVPSQWPSPSFQDQTLLTCASLRWHSSLTDIYFHHFVFIFVSYISWQILKTNMMKNTAEKSAKYDQSNVCPLADNHSQFDDWFMSLFCSDRWGPDSDDSFAKSWNNCFWGRTLYEWKVLICRCDNHYQSVIERKVSLICFIIFYHYKSSYHDQLQQSKLIM